MVQGVKQKLIEKLETTPLLRQQTGLYNLSAESIMNFTPEKALAVLNYLNNFKTRTDNSINEYQTKLDEEKAQAEKEAEEARIIKEKAYADIPVDKLDDKYAEKNAFAEEMWDRLIDKLGIAADKTKRANNNYIATTIFRRTI